MGVVDRLARLLLDNRLGVESNPQSSMQQHIKIIGAVTDGYHLQMHGWVGKWAGRGVDWQGKQVRGRVGKCVWFVVWLVWLVGERVCQLAAKCTCSCPIRIV